MLSRMLSLSLSLSLSLFATAVHGPEGWRLPVLRLVGLPQLLQWILRPQPIHPKRSALQSLVLRFFRNGT